MDLYRNPLYYDIAFSWELESEIAFLKEVFDEHVPFPVERLLEPACGSGRFLRELPSHDIEAVGYDISPEMVSFARGSIERAGLASKAQVLPGDMRSARFDPPFDAALNSINSFCYLLTDADVEAHLAATADSLRSGAVYVVHFSMALETDQPGEVSTWEMERDDVRVVTHWSIEEEDREAGVGTHLCRMEVDDNGDRSVFEDRHRLKVWTDEGFRRMLESSGFTLVGIRGDGYTYDRVPLETRITGDMGNHYFILKRR
ncbi:MAG: methyltransferase domain-containing protein [Candidatus Eisenbacteria bacterium]|nr:methyltransferase domain-containing protein [Candidatus Eisenbacteria bacterium]